MAVTLDLGPLVALQQQLARAALASGIAIYGHAVCVLVLLTGSVLHPSALVLLVPILVAQARAVRTPARLLVSGRLPRAYRTFFRLQLLFIAVFSIAAAPEGGPVGGLLAGLFAALTAKPIVRARRLAQAVDSQIRSVQDSRALLACLSKDVRSLIATRTQSFAGDRMRLVLPWATAIATGAVVSLAATLLLSVMGLQPGGGGIGVIGGLAALWVFFRTTRHAKPPAALLRTHDARPPVLLLRQFGDDSLTRGRLHLVRPTFEHFIAGELARVGPAISVGTPGERLQPLGAAREYLTGDWKRGVHTLIGDAGLVVFLLGESENLLWEFRTTMAARDATCALVIVPPLAKPAELARRWARFVVATRDVVNGALPAALPDRPIVAVFFTGDEPVMMVADRRTPAPSLVSQAAPEFRVALRLYEHLRTDGLVSAASLASFMERFVPLVRVSNHPDPAAT